MHARCWKSRSNSAATRSITRAQSSRAEAASRTSCARLRICVVSLLLSKPLASRETSVAVGASAAAMIRRLDEAESFALGVCVSPISDVERARAPRQPLSAVVGVRPRMSGVAARVVSSNESVELERERCSDGAASRSWRRRVEPGPGNVRPDR